MFLINFGRLAEWDSTLHSESERSLFKSHLHAWADFGTQPCYEATSDLWDELEIAM